MKKIITLLLCLSFFACKEQNSSNKKDYALSQLRKGERFENIFSIEKEIELEATRESLISFPCDLCILNRYYAVSSRASEVKLFSKHGKFIRKIGRIGKGPGEYITVTSVFKISDSVIGIYDEITNKFLQYDINGALLKEEKNSIQSYTSIRKIIFYKNKYYIQFPFTESTPFQLLKLNSDYLLEKGILPGDLNYTGYTYRGLFDGDIILDSAANKIYAINTFSHNNIYSFDLLTESIDSIILQKPFFFENVSAAKKNETFEKIIEMYRSGTGIFRALQINRFTFLIMYMVPSGASQLIKSYLYELSRDKVIEISNSKELNCSDGKYLYSITFEKLQKHSGADISVDNPSIIIYKKRN